MPSSSGFRVLLISRAPDMHLETIRSFREQGAQILEARDSARALALLRHLPELVLVDVAIGARLTPSLVRALNRDDGWRVVALHDGHLEFADESAFHLNVQGFCRARDFGSGLWRTGGWVHSALAIH